MNGDDLILIVDDDEDMRDTIRASLEMAGYKTIEAGDSTSMFKLIETNDVSLILLDLVLPGSDGLQIMRDLRPVSDIPVVMLTGKGDIIDKIVGLEVGADDYITKPFHGRELTARIKSVLRRKQPNVPEGTSSDGDEVRAITFNGWELNLFSHTLTDPQGEDVKITGHEFAILKALTESAGRVLSRDQLLDRMSVGEREWSPFDRSLDVMIAKVRKKLGDVPKDPKFIRTVRQSGYMFIADVAKQ